jgi:hypothetical protein
MKEIITISTGAADYITDHGTWTAVANPAGALTTNCAFIQAVATFYIKVCPVNDPWNTAYQVFVNTATAPSGLTVPAGDWGLSDFLIGSFGKNGIAGPTIQLNSYTTSNPQGGMYNVSTMADFNNDLWAYDGNWIVAPQSALVSGS